MTAEALLDAISANWGPPARAASFETGSLTVHVVKYEHTSTGEGVVIYATATTGPTPSGHFTDFLLGLDVAHDEVADPLARLSAFARATAVHHGDTVPIAESLWRGTELRRFLVMGQEKSVLGPFDVAGHHVEFMNAIPIYESELPIKASLGGDGFIAELRRHGIEFWDSNRPPLPNDIRGR